LFPQAKCYQAYNVKYVVPGTKNMHGNFKIYQPGQEVQITGHIVDFDMNLQITIVMVSGSLFFLARSSSPVLIFLID
jgi:hypothetical protein